MAVRALAATLLVALLGAAPSASATGWTEGPALQRFAVYVAPCKERPMSCLELRWRATDPDSVRLRFDLVVERASGTRAFVGEGHFLPDRPVSAYLEPRRRPACGRYDVTLTVADEQGLQSSETRSVVRRSGCVRRRGGSG
jgi:hypothetical protein